MKKIGGVMFPMRDHKREIEEFEQIGEQEVRYRMAAGTFYGDTQLAHEWLKVQESSRRDEREAETLSIARQARWIAIAAAIIAAVFSTLNTVITKLW